MKPQRFDIEDDIIITHDSPLTLHHKKIDNLQRVTYTLCHSILSDA